MFKQRRDEESMMYSQSQSLMGPHVGAVYWDIITVMRAAWQLHWLGLGPLTTTDPVLCSEH